MNTITKEFNKAASNKIERLAVAEHKSRGALAAGIREAVLAGQWSEVAEAFGRLVEAYGQRHAIGKGPKGETLYSASTPADSLRASLNNVTSHLVANRADNGYKYGRLAPALFEDSEGGEKWGLVDKDAKRMTRERAVPAKTLVKKVDAVAALCQTHEEQVSAVLALAAKFGLVVEVK